MKPETQLTITAIGLVASILAWAWQTPPRAKKPISLKSFVRTPAERAHARIRTAELIREGYPPPQAYAIANKEARAKR